MAKKKPNFREAIEKTALNNNIAKPKVDAFTDAILGKSLRGNPREAEQPVVEAEVVDNTPLSVDEETTLANCEKVIHAGLETFIEVGRALETIRSNRLYRQHYRDFDTYMQERLGLDRIRGYEMTRRAIVFDQLQRELPPNTTYQPPVVASQLDAIATIPPDKRTDTFIQAATQAEEQGKKLTAKLIEQQADAQLPSDTQVYEAQVSPEHLADQLKARFQALSTRQREAGVDVRILGSFLVKNGLVELYANYRAIDPSTINRQFSDSVPLRDAIRIGLI